MYHGFAAPVAAIFTSALAICAFLDKALQRLPKILHSLLAFRTALRINRHVPVRQRTGKQARGHRARATAKKEKPQSPTRQTRPTREKSGATALVRKRRRCDFMRSSSHGAEISRRAEKKGRGMRQARG